MIFFPLNVFLQRYVIQGSLISWLNIYIIRFSYTMIDPDFRFRFYTGNNYGLDTDCCTTILDSDQRRLYYITGPGTYFTEEEEAELLPIETLKRYFELLSPSVQSITVDGKGLLVSVSTDIPFEERGSGFLEYLYRPKLSSVVSLTDCPTIFHSRLTETDRLACGVDLMEDTGNPKVKRVFKYDTTHNWRFLWNEMHILKSLPPHPNIGPLDALVLDEVDTRILGFTTRFVDGGDFKSNATRPFKLKWLRQLTDTLDFLHLEMGIVHGDMQPKNILVNPDTGNLQLFDFGMAGEISDTRIHVEIQEVAWVLYEIITHDTALREERFQGAGSDASMILNMSGWPVRAKLTCKATRLRKHLDDWIKRRTKALPVIPTKHIDIDWNPLYEPSSSPATEAFFDSLWPWLERNDPDWREDGEPPGSPSNVPETKPTRHAFQWRRLPYYEAYPDRRPDTKDLEEDQRRKRRRIS